MLRWIKLSEVRTVLDFGSLELFGQNSFQLVVGDAHGISQPAACAALHEVCTALSDRINIFMHFPPNQAEKRLRIQEFYIAQFSGVIGCTDCTHVRAEVPLEAIINACEALTEAAKK